MSDTENLNDPVGIAIKKLENHPSVQAINQNVSVNQNFFSLTLMSVINLKELKL